MRLIDRIRRNCIVHSLIDAIYYTKWYDRTYNFNAQWSPQKEFFELDDSSDATFCILFTNDLVIAAIGHGTEEWIGSINGYQSLPNKIREFIEEEPIVSFRIVCTIWIDSKNEIKTFPNGFNIHHWKNIFDPSDDENELTSYINRLFPNNRLDIKELLSYGDRMCITKEIVRRISVNFNSWKRLKDDLAIIGFDLR